MGVSLRVADASHFINVKVKAHEERVSEKFL